MNLPLTTVNITFLNNIDPSIIIDKSSQFRYEYLTGLHIYDIQTFIKLIQINS
jgi:hypothetical protein